MSDEFEILDYLEDDLYEDSDEEWEAPEPTVEPIDTVRLGPNTLYYSGFIIKESADGNSIINYSSRFQRRNKGIVKTIGNRLVRKLEENIKVDDMELFKIVKGVKMEIDGGDAIGHKVFIAGNKYILVYAYTVSVTESNFDMEPDFGDQVVVNKSSVLAQYFGDVEYEQKLYSPGITTNKIAEGKQIFIECYNKIKNDPVLATLTGSSVAFRDGSDRFIRRLEINTIEQYGSHIGRFLSLLVESGNLRHFKDSTTKWNGQLLAKSVMEFIKEETSNDTSNLCELIIPLMIFNYKTNSYYSSNYITTMLDAVKYMIKVSMFCCASKEEFNDFHRDPLSKKLYNFIQTLYKRLFIELSEQPHFTVSRIKPGVVCVNDITVDVKHLRHIYLSAVSAYNSTYNDLCTLLKQYIPINNAYTHFLNTLKQDHTRKGLVTNIKENKFLAKDENLMINHEAVLLIDKMTKLLFVILYIASANTFRGLELRQVNIAASLVEERNVVYRHGTVCILTTFGKNRKFQCRERFYNQEVAKIIIHHCLSLKPLMLSMLSLDKEQVLFHQTQLFSLLRGDLCNNDHYYKMVSVVTGEIPKYVLRMRHIRQGLSHMIRHDIRVNDEGSYRHLLESAQGHSWRSGDNTYGIVEGWDKLFSVSRLESMFKFFNAYNAFMGIDEDVIEVPKKNPEILVEVDPY